MPGLDDVTVSKYYMSRSWPLATASSPRLPPAKGGAEAAAGHCRDPRPPRDLPSHNLLNDDGESDELVRRAIIAELRAAVSEVGMTWAVTREWRFWWRFYF